MVMEGVREQFQVTWESLASGQEDALEEILLFREKMEQKVETGDSLAGTGRFGKSTHISMISNSVTHLRSYTNSATADIAGNSAPILPATPRGRRPEQRRLRIERRRLRIERRYGRRYGRIE